MYVDIAALVREALLDSGCDPSLLGNFDSHSTIALDFNDMPSIYISSSDDDIWLWSRIAEYQDTILEQCSYNLLKELLEGAEYIRGGIFRWLKMKTILSLRRCCCLGVWRTNKISPVH
ncbi:hypothetical protein SODG_006734 [Sodalis praecaptivus]